jgi:hypothetical protein
MTDKPTQCHPGRPPLQLPPNFRDVTAERIGVFTAIAGTTAAGKMAGSTGWAVQLSWPGCQKGTQNAISDLLCFAGADHYRSGSG